MKLTLSAETNVETLPAGEYRDPRGILLVVRASGARTFYTTGPGSTRTRIGRYPQVTVQRALLQLGVDDPKLTLDGLMRAWVNEQDIEWRDKGLTQLRSANCPLLAKKLTDLTRINLAAYRTVLLSDRSKRVANLHVKWILSAIKWGFETGLTQVRPDSLSVRAIKVPTSQRDRVLEVDEARRLLGAIHPRSVGLIKFLLLSGARLNEALGIDDCELQSGTNIWTIPARRSKPGRDVKKYLTEEAIAILANRGFSTGWGLTERQVRLDFDEARLATGIVDVKLHDLRATFATLAASVASLSQVGAMLGHATNSKVAAVYVRNQGSVALGIAGQVGALLGLEG